MGQPIGNTRFLVLDEKMEPVPPGSTGELYIGGDGVARGYRNRPDLTRQKFVPNPFDKKSMLYRTGDLVKYG